MKRLLIVLLLVAACGSSATTDAPAATTYDWHKDVPANATRLQVPDEVYISGLTAYAGDCKLIDKYRQQITEALGYDGWGHICG